MKAIWGEGIPEELSKESPGSASMIVAVTVVTVVNVVNVVKVELFDEWRMSRWRELCNGE